MAIRQEIAYVAHNCTIKEPTLSDYRNTNKIVAKTLGLSPVARIKAQS